LKTNKVNLFVSSVLCVFWYHSPNVLDTLHICNISWLRVKCNFFFNKRSEEPWSFMKNVVVKKNTLIKGANKILPKILTFF
jgi:hypothetical protein